MTAMARSALKSLRCREKWRARRESNPRPSASKWVQVGGDKVRLGTTPAYSPPTCRT